MVQAHCTICHQQYADTATFDAHLDRGRCRFSPAKEFVPVTLAGASIPVLTLG